MSGPTQLPLPKPDAAAIPAAAYVRMSTEHQQFSTENQLDRIKEYAARRGMEIVRVFEDLGKSGLNVRGRESTRGSPLNSPASAPAPPAPGRSAVAWS